MPVTSDIVVPPPREAPLVRVGTQMILRRSLGAKPERIARVASRSEPRWHVRLIDSCGSRRQTVDAPTRDSGNKSPVVAGVARRPVVAVKQWQHCVLPSRTDPDQTLR